MLHSNLMTKRSVLRYFQTFVINAHKRYVLSRTVRFFNWRMQLNNWFMAADFLFKLISHPFFYLHGNRHNRKWFRKFVKPSMQMFNWQKEPYHLLRELITSDLLPTENPKVPWEIKSQNTLLSCVFFFHLVSFLYFIFSIFCSFFICIIFLV